MPVEALKARLKCHCDKPVARAKSASSYAVAERLLHVLDRKPQLPRRELGSAFPARDLPIEPSNLDEHRDNQAFSIRVAERPRHATLGGQHLRQRAKVPRREVQPRCEVGPRDPLAEPLRELGAVERER